MPVSSDIVATYKGPRRAFARILAMGQREDRALMILMAGCLMAFIARWPVLARQAHMSGEELNMLLGGSLLAIMFVLPLAFYLVGGLSHVIAKLLGGKGSWYSARLALFWAFLAVSPIILFRGLIASMVGPGAGLQLVEFVWFAVFLWFWLSCLFEAERAK